MQIVYKNKNERYNSRRIDTMGIILCIRRIGIYLERNHNGRFSKKTFEL